MGGQQKILRSLQNFCQSTSVLGEPSWRQTRFQLTKLHLFWRRCPGTQKSSTATAPVEGEKGGAIQTKKATPGQQIKSTGLSAETTAAPERPRPAESVQAAPSGNEGPTQPRDPSTAMGSLKKINDTLDCLTDSITRLTASMGSVTSEMNSLKRKQDFLEASWQDPDFEYQYNAQQGGFYQVSPEGTEEGEVPEPSNKRSKQDGGETPASSSTSVQDACEQPITTQNNDAMPAINGGQNGVEPNTGLLGKMKKKFQLEEKIGAPINSGLAKMVDILLSKGCASGSLDNMNYNRPANVEFMQKIKINPSLWSTFSKNTRTNDIKFQTLHESIVAGMIPLLEATNDCFNAAENGGQVDPEKLVSTLTDSVAILADTCHQVGMMRRRVLRPIMKEQYRTLCNQDNAITTELFGDNLSTTAKDLGEINKLANTITFSNTYSRGRGYQANRRGRGGYRGNGRGQPFLYNGPNNNSNQYRGRGNTRRPGSGFPRRRGAV